MRTVLLRTAIAARVADTQVTPNVELHVTVPAGTLARTCRNTVCALVVWRIRSVPAKALPDFRRRTEALDADFAPR